MPDFALAPSCLCLSLSLSLIYTDVPNIACLFTDSFRCADGIRGTGGGVYSPKTCTDVGRTGDAFAVGAGMLVGGR